MLSSLYINNIAIIDEMNINFETGLNMITGETGAGKSIIVNAIAFLMGNRFSKDHIRTGQGKAVIEGVFLENKDEFIIRRVFTASGLSQNFINDEPVNLSELSLKTAKLVDLHGQHEHKRLLNQNNHIGYLDAFGTHESIINNVRKSYDKVESMKKSLIELNEKQNEFKEKRELFVFQLQELNDYSLELDNDTRLSEEYSVLSNASHIIKTLENSKNLADGTESSAISILSDIRNQIGSITQFNQKYEDLYSRMESFIIELNEWGNDIDIQKNSISVNEERLEGVSEQLTHIELLKKKYGGSMQQVIDYRDKIASDINDNDQFADKINVLSKKISEETTKLNKFCSVLSDTRKKSSIILQELITEHLSEMDMSDTQFLIILEQPESISDMGFDNCKFYISTNIGESIRPLVKVVSGGEVSRIMLAIKLALQTSDFVDTLIFDEIDNGISGSTADKEGEKIKELSHSHQILCISHLSQIVGKGEHHYKVKKQKNEDRTFSEIEKLDKMGRVKEIASLISGTTITDESLEQAKQLIEDYYG